MRRALISSATFRRKARRFHARNPQLAEDLAATLERLNEDAFQPMLRTHKLKGKQADFWACSAGYDLRIIFQLVESEGAEAILLENFGTHDEIY